MCSPKHRWDFGRGRYIPIYNNKVKVHIFVQRRIEHTKGTVDAYTPQAHNWDMCASGDAHGAVCCLDSVQGNLRLLLEVVSFIHYLFA